MNACYLMLSTLVVAVAGFIFWVVVARSYDAAAVGLATTLLSVSGLLSLLGLAGFDTTFVRFLPNIERKNEYINNGFIITTFISAGLGAGLALLLPFISPSLSILSSKWAFVAFVFFTVIASLNVLTNAVYLAFKRTRYTLLINVLLSVCKVALPLLVARGNALTIFVLAGGAQLIGLALSILWLRHKFNYRFSPKLDLRALRVVKKFSLTMYASSVLNLLPPTLLPLLIVHQLGPENAAYYYMAFTIAGVLYTIAYASMQSAFAEGSHNAVAIHAHVAKAAKLIAALLLPATLVVMTMSGILLTAFGQAYAQGAQSLLQLFALSALPVAFYSALGAIFKVTKNLPGIVGMNIIYATVTLGASYLLMPHLGLIAIGWGWAIGNLAACSMGIFFLITANNKKRGDKLWHDFHSQVAM